MVINQIIPELSPKINFYYAARGVGTVKLAVLPPVRRCKTLMASNFDRNNKKRAKLRAKDEGNSDNCDNNGSFGPFTYVCMYVHTSGRATCEKKGHPGKRRINKIGHK